MINAWLDYVKNYHIDAVDPDSTILKAALRTALACMVCIVLLQLSGEIALSAWGGFAAFAFVQNDIQDSFFNRLWFLIAVILIFTGLTFSGMLLGNRPWLFWATVPVVSFGCAYIACLGFQYFNAGMWALFLYIMAGANPANLVYAEKIGLIFLLCGLVSVIICFVIFPIQPYQRIIRHYKRILAKILQLFEGNAKQNEKQMHALFAQLDKLLELQESNLAFYLKSQKLTQQEQLLSLERWLYQIGLMTKSILSWFQRINTHPHYPEMHLEGCQQLIILTLKSMLRQIRHKHLPDFSVINAQLENYRENITQFRRKEVAQTTTDFSECLDYAAYFYHCEKFLELLEKASLYFSQLAGKR